jgi:ATPase subunit of ABC transporter with duplicated ATPase domains
MLNINRISLNRGNKEILKDITLTLGPDEKVGLVGVNGAGKSTLLKIICGIEEPDLGNISLKGSYSYLAQETHKTMDVNNYNNLTIGEYLIIEKNLEVEEWEIKKLLNNLKMEDKDCDSKLGELSGGQKIKVEIIKILLEKADLLILDEPTNFLDIPSAEWLMRYLVNYPKSVLAVSHDLRLMNKGISKIWFLNERTHEVEVYRGNYEQFLKVKALKDEFLVKQLESEEKKVKKVFELAQTLSGRKSIKEKKRAAKRFEQAAKLKEEVKELQTKMVKSKKMQITIPTPSQSSKEVLEAHGISKEYVKGKPILKNVTLDIQRYDRLAIIGKNGAGKTTLLKILAGKQPQTKGKYKWGYNTKVGYYSQENEDLDLNITVWENVYKLDWGTMDKRKFLGRFLISGDMVNQKVATLSGGEKTRLALAKLFAGGYNVLLLDEPTTYLDPESQNVLLNALKDYKGTILLVSHEPQFVKNLEINKTLLMPEEYFGYFKEEYIERVGIT